LRDLKRPSAAWASRLTNEQLAALCQIDEGLEAPLEAPVYTDTSERDQIAVDCRASFLAWCIEALRHSGGYEPAAHHRLLIEHLEAVARGQIAKLMIFMPPGSAKSTYTSELLPAWFEALAPGEPIIAASHTGKLALRFSGRVQRYIRAFGDVLGYSLASEARERWENTHGAEYLAAGVGGAIPGYRAGLAIIDDPYPGRKEADSETYRDSVWQWWNGDLLPRLKPRAGVILMHTRYHEDDLAGRLLDIEGLEWTVLKLPAVAEDPRNSTPKYPIGPDPLGRAPGEPLWTDQPNYPFGALMLRKKMELERSGSTREWQSQYQQNPRPAEGALFQTGMVEVLDEAPNLRGAQIGRGWDLAATRKIGTNDPDWTVGVKLARMASGLYIVLDVFRDRLGPDKRDNAIFNLSNQDGRGTCSISIPQDPGQAGKTQVLALTRLLTGHKIESSVETGDKATRATPVMSQLNAGNLAIVKAPWNRVFLDELAAFPNGAKDDQVDALSRAFSIVGLAPTMFNVSNDLLTAMGKVQRR
jgi:predicted phage terminase large subunit-like protein